MSSNQNVLILLTMILMIGNGTPSIITSKTTYDFWVDPLSYYEIAIDCPIDSSLSGNFRILVDGDQYEGDQQKYDLWPAVQKISLMIFQDMEYYQWISELNSTPIYSKNDYSQLSWNIAIREPGRYHIVFVNDAITRKRIQCQIFISNDALTVLQYLLILGSILVAFILLIVYYRKRT